MRKKDLLMMLAMGCLLVLVSFGVAFSADRVKAAGMMKSIEEDGTVIIDKTGYLVSPSVSVQNYKGAPSSLKHISLPHNVYFEYEYTKHGFMIVFIKETAG